MDGEYIDDVDDVVRSDRGARKRKKPGIIRSTFFTFGYVLLIFRKALVDDLKLMWDDLRLFIGAVVVVIGLLSFESERYCDGTAATHAACTRPSTYYYFEPWTIAMITLGCVLLLLWWVRRRA